MTLMWDALPTLANGFTFVALPPVVTSVSPNTGTTTGGTHVTPIGKNFVSGARVTFGAQQRLRWWW